MRLEDLQKQVEQIQLMDFKNMPPEQFNQIVEQLSKLVETGEELLNQDIQTQINNESED